MRRIAAKAPPESKRSRTLAGGSGRPTVRVRNSSTPADSFDVFQFDALPQGWDLAPLGSLVSEAFGGGTPSTRVPEYWDGDIPWTTSAVLQNGEVYLERHQRTVTRRGLEESASRLAPARSVLVGTRVGVGKTAVATRDIAISQDLTALVPKEGVSPEFLALVLKAPVVARWFDANKRGTTIKGVTRTDVLCLKVPLPARAEQDAISSSLLCVRRALDACEHTIAAVRQLKASLLRHLFTYGLTSPDQADQVPLKKTPYGDVPVAWPLVPIGQCAHVQTGVAKGRKLEGDVLISVPYLRVANVQSGALDLSEMKNINIRSRELQRYLLQDGDVVLTEGGDFDKLGRGFIWRGEVSPCVHQNHIFAVRADRSQLLPDFLAYLVQSDYGRSYFLNVAHRTTHLACINKTKLQAFPALLPPLPEQRAIATQLSGVDTKLEAEEMRLQALERLFRSMLDKLMSGSVRLPQFVGETS